MHIKIENGMIQDSDADAIIVNLFEGVKEPGGGTGAVDQALDFALRDLIAQGDISGQLGETLVIYPMMKIPTKRVIVVGLGPSDTFDYEEVREAAGAAIKKARDLGAKTVATIVHGTGIGNLDPILATEALVEGSRLALYQYDAPGTLTASKPQKRVDSLTIIEVNADKIAAIETGAGQGNSLAEGIMRARTLVNQPSNVATPTVIAASAAEVGAETDCNTTIYDEDWMRAQGMNVALAVTQGSTEPAKFIVMEHKPAEADKAEGPIVLVGKGVAFDTGGYSLKSTTGMLGMKGDMGGAAAVIGAMEAISKLNLPRHVIGIVPTVENMVSGTAFKPNDVFIAKNGVSVEIISTDAEGRLILADALCYAATLSPKIVVDVATLTGGKMVALGARRQALFCNHSLFYMELLEAGNRAGEPLWEMPLDDAYNQQLKSLVADIKNTGGRQASAVTAAMFLSHFIGDHPWAHIDIAGAEFVNGKAEEMKKSYIPKGATGIMVRTFVEFVRKLSL